MATEPECLCQHRFLPNGIRHVQQAHPLCPIHGDVRDTGFVIDNKDDRITAIEDAIEELDHDNR